MVLQPKLNHIQTPIIIFNIKLQSDNYLEASSDHLHSGEIRTVAPA